MLPSWKPQNISYAILQASITSIVFQRVYEYILTIKQQKFYILYLFANITLVIFPFYWTFTFALPFASFFPCFSLWIFLSPHGFQFHLSFSDLFYRIRRYKWQYNIKEIWQAWWPHVTSRHVTSRTKFWLLQKSDGQQITS